MTLCRLAPPTTTGAVSNDPGTVIALFPVEGPGRRVFAALAASWDGVAVVLGRPVAAAGAVRARRELAEAAYIAQRICSRGCVIDADDLLPYRWLASTTRAELQHLVDRTVGGVLRAPLNERDKLLDALWARHRLDTDTAAVRSLGIDPKTMRRRQERIKELTGLDPSRRRHRFRLELGLHALHLLETTPSHGGLSPSSATGEREAPS